MSDADVLFAQAIAVGVLGIVLNVLKRAVRKRGYDRPLRSGRGRSEWVPDEPKTPPES